MPTQNKATDLIDFYFKYKPLNLTIGSILESKEDKEKTLVGYLSEKGIKPYTIKKIMEV